MSLTIRSGSRPTQVTLVHVRKEGVLVELTVLIYSALYCTDIAETVQAPVFHVNADEPEMVDAVMRLALDFRQTFHKDVVIDVIGSDPPFQ